MLELKMKMGATWAAIYLYLEGQNEVGQLIGKLFLSRLVLITFRMVLGYL